MRMYGGTTITFILLVLVLKSQQEQNQLAPVINDLSIVARLINGISLQSDFMRSSQNLNAVVGELLGIGDSNAIPELLKVKVKDLMKDVDGILKDVKGLPASSSQDLEAVGDALGFLKKVDLAKVKKAIKVDLGAFGTKWNDASRVKFRNILPDPFLSVVENFKYVMETEVAIYPSAQTEMLNKFQAFVQKARIIGDTFQTIKSEAKRLKIWEDIMDIKSDLQEFPHLSQVFEEYLKNMNSLLTLHQSLADMKSAIDGLKPIIKRSQASSATNQILEAMSMFSTDKTADKNLTIGLPNGIGDLKLIFEDLNGKWLEENLANGKDMKMLVTALKPLQKFYESLKPVETSWNKLKKDPETGENIGNIASILKNSKILNPDDLIAKSSQGVNCMKMLSAIPATSLENFDVFFQNLDKFFAQLKLCKENVDKVTASAITSKIIVYEWRMLTSITSSNMHAELAKFRNDKDIQEMSAFIFEYVKSMQSVDNGQIEKMFNEWNVVPTVQTDISRTGLVAASECLSNMNFDFTATEAFYRVDQGIQRLKTQNNMEESMKMFEEVMETLISADKKLKETVNGMGVSRRRRRRSGQGSEAKGLLKLADSGKVARELGNAVQVLREMSEVFENQEKVMKVARSDAAVDTVIQSIPEMNRKWTVENKKALEKLVDEVNKLNGNVDKNQSLKGIWKQFGEAQSVNGAPIEGRILGTLVFGVLEKNSDPNVKTASGDFKDFPPLQLDFTGSKRIYLRDASMILVPITSFFKDFFAIDTNSNTSPSSDSPNYLLYAGIGAGCLALLTAVAVGGYCGFRAYRSNEKWKNRERHWLYLAFQEEQLTALICSKESDKAKVAIRKGAYVNSYHNGQSCLHLAVSHQLADVVELLILNGADTTALSYDMKTPEVQEIDGKEDEGKARKIKAIFQKYKGKSFKQRIPKLLPYNKFTVYTGASDLSADFQRTFKGMIKMTELFSSATHVVVDVDKDGVYHYKKDKLEEFFAVAFGPSVAVSSEWARLCAKSASNFYKDYDFRVTKVKFMGKIYTNVDKLKEFARGRHIAYGMKINVSYLTGSQTDACFNRHFTALGFLFCGSSDQITPSEGMKSFYRPEINPNFIVCEGESIDEFSDKLEGVNLNYFTVMTLNQFFVFLLELKMTGGKGASQFPIKASTPTNKTKTTSTSKTNSISKATSTVKSPL